ncbi:MAG TPA: type 4a pilus biogenesis protein PilO [Candidatus Bathyarchaeia archaeon]|nr:type 4a pilus biogenesis protein PilO [Candidatus Bathyarchaeia archaeon]
MSSRTRLAFGVAAALFFVACNSSPSRSGSPADKGARAAAARKAEFFAGLKARHGEAARVWNAINAALTQGVWLTEADYDVGRIRIKGRTATNNFLADFISRLGESPGLASVALGGSVMKTARGREVMEFSISAQAIAARENGSGPVEFPAREDMAAVLREVQRLALGSGLKMTKFAPGVEVAAEFSRNIPVSVEVSGDRTALASYLDGWADLPGYWIVDKVLLRASSPDDPRSPVRVSVAARAYFTL